MITKSGSEVHGGDFHLIYDIKRAQTISRTRCPRSPVRGVRSLPPQLFGAVPRDQNTGTMEHMSGARLRALPVVVITLAAALSACSTHPTSPLSATSSDLAACQAYYVQYQSQSGSLPPVAVPYLFQLLGKADNATLRADGKSMQSEVEKVYASDPSSPQRTQATAAFNAATRSVTSTCRAMGDAPTP